jgi:hypothetical protein
MRTRVVYLLTLVLVLVMGVGPALAAVSCTVLSESQSTANTASYATASVSPAGDRLILAIAQSTRNGTTCASSELSSVTGNGLTWVFVNRQCHSSAVAPTHTVEIYRSMGASPSSGAVTLDYGANAQLNAAWAIVECTGVDTGGSNGADAVVQSAITLSEPGTAINATLAAFGSAGNATLAAFGLDDNIAATVEGSFTHLADEQVSDGGNDQALHVSFLASSDTSPSASFTSIDVGTVAIEIKAAVSSNIGGEPLWFP